MRFFDASALVKRYLREDGTDQVRSLLRSDDVAVCRLSEIEVVSAFARLAREGAISLSERDAATAALMSDLRAWTVVEITQDVTRVARRLLLQHPLRSGDAIQLAAALTLNDALPEGLAGWVAYDARLNAAAQAEQLR